jgi:hypothetical protein
LAKEFPELQGIFLWKESEKESEKTGKEPGEQGTNPGNRKRVRTDSTV